MDEENLEGYSLDPEDWQGLRQLGHRMLDDMFDYQMNRTEGLVWQPMPDEVRQRFYTPVPQAGMAAEEVYQRFRSEVVPYSMGNSHARFWGWVMGNGTPLGMLADMLAAGLNPTMGGGAHAPALVELQVVDWCRQLFEMPEGTSGLLTSGGSVANLIGLAVARQYGADFDIRAEGVYGTQQRMTIYASSEVHSSVDKAIELLGLGNRSLRKIRVDENYRIDVEALRTTIDKDLAAGYKPIALVGCAGTTNTGAIDPLVELADIAQEYGLWYHIDGAFGALGYLAPELRPRLAGLSRADSLAFDLHKLVYLPMEIGGTLVRDEELHRRTFSLRPDYLHEGGRGLAAPQRWLSDYGIQLTRAFRALKAWMAFQAHGSEKIGKTILKNVDQAQYLMQLIEADPDLEVLAPTDLNIVCFRFAPASVPEDDFDGINEELLYRLQESGVAVPSSTMLNGHFAIRVSITNHRSRRQDFDLLVDEIKQKGEQLLAGGK